MNSNARTPIHSPQPLDPQDSPFSDYFTDSSMGSSSASPSYAQKKLVQRLSNIGAQLLRKDPDEHVWEVLHMSINCMEETLGAVDSQSRQPADAADSGIFLADDDPFTAPSFDIPHQALTPPGIGRRNSTHHHNEFLDIPPDVVERDDEDDEMLLSEACALLERVSQASAQLRERFTEVQHANDVQAEQLSETTHEILTLRSANEALKQDLSFDHSELLFLKLQLKTLELQAQPWMEQNSGDRDLARDIERWKADWSDVEKRLKERRTEHINSLQAGKLGDSGDEGDEGEQKADQYEETGDGAQSITIERMSGVEEEGGNMESRYPVAFGEDTATEEWEDMESEYFMALGEITAAEERILEGDWRMLSDGGDDEYEDEEQKDGYDTKLPPNKTPVQELWDGLMALAGINNY